MANALKKTHDRLSSPVGVASSSPRSEGLGFPVAATIGAVAAVGSSALPFLLGGGPSAAERRQAMIRVQKGAKELRSEMEEDMASIASQAESWSESRAREVIDNNAQSYHDHYLSKYSRIAMNHELPSAQTTARNMAETIQEYTISEANTRIAWIRIKENKVPLFGIGAGILGGGLLLWNQYS